MFITANNAQLFTISFGQGGRSLLALGGWAGSWGVWAGTVGGLGPACHSPPAADRVGSGS